MSGLAAAITRTSCPSACAAPPKQPWNRSRPSQRLSQWQESQRTRGRPGTSSSLAPPKRQRQQRQRAAVRVQAAFTPKSGRDKIPIFPLSIVALPAADVPLHIFEARYRVLFNTLMAGSQGVDEGLVNPDKPWCGTRLFGMSFYDSRMQGLASIGTLLEISDHANLEDGRLLVNSVGRQRFKIVNVVEEKPVLVCEVEYLPEDKDASAEGPEARELASEVVQLMRNVMALSVKARDTAVPEELTNPRQLSELGPRDLSFWVASLFGNPYQQQALLEEETAVARLKAVREVLDGTFKYLSAQVALQSAFKTTGGGGTPPPGGPD